MKNLEKIFQHQIWHLVSLIVLIAAIKVYLSGNPDALDGSLWGITTEYWFWLAIWIPVIHQVYVWLVWRLELYQRAFSRRFGLRRSFAFYAVGFSLLFVGRLLAIIVLAYSNRNTVLVSPFIPYALALLISPFVIYLFYSVKTYFTIERAYGIDHFDKDYNEPYVKQGIFEYTDNGMYIFGLMILYLPGLVLLSKAAILAAIFNHLFIWAHYYFTERPDMQEIYGDAP